MPGLVAVPASAGEVALAFSFARAFSLAFPGRPFEETVYIVFVEVLSFRIWVFWPCFGVAFFPQELSQV